jgi:hypothetical protein
VERLASSTGAEVSFWAGSPPEDCCAGARRSPAASTRRRTRSACASSMLEEWLRTPMPSWRQSSNASLLVSPSSAASS